MGFSRPLLGLTKLDKKQKYKYSKEIKSSEYNKRYPDLSTELVKNGTKPCILKEYYNTNPRVTQI